MQGHSMELGPSHCSTVEKRSNDSSVFFKDLARFALEISGALPWSFRDSLGFLQSGLAAVNPPLKHQGGELFTGTPFLLSV